MSSRILTAPTLILALTMLGGTAHAQSRFIVGARNLAMGGTGVGGSSDAIAVYYNPAGMAFSKGWEFQLPLVTLDAELEKSIIENLNDLRRTLEQSTVREIQERLNDGTATLEDLETVLEVFLDELPRLDTTEDGAIARAVAGPSFRWKNWGVSAFYTGSGGLDALVDLTTGLSLSTAGLPGAIPDPVPADACGGDPICLSYADDLVQETGIDPARAEVLVAASGDSLSTIPGAYDILTDIVNATVPGNPTLADNPSEINGTGILTGQAAFTYSRLVYREKLSFGVTAKVMSGETYSQGTRVADLDGNDDYDDYIGQGNVKTDTTLGIDLGVMYRPTPRWSVGLVAGNVNTPEFELAGNRGSIEMQPLLRTGVAYRPLRWFNAAFDIDVNAIDSGLVRGLEYRYANAGVEFLVGDWFAGRIGAYRNVGVEASNTIYTGGVAFGFRRFSVDLAVGAAADRTLIEPQDGGRTVPSGFAASIQFNWRPKREHRQL